MTGLLMICAFLIAMVMLAVLFPFFFGPGGTLQDASVTDDDAELDMRLTAILRRWLKDESAFERGEVSALEWRQRKKYLVSRYVDGARRLAWLRSQQLNEERPS